MKKHIINNILYFFIIATYIITTQLLYNNLKIESLNTFQMGKEYLLLFLILFFFGVILRFNHTIRLNNKKVRLTIDWLSLLFLFLPTAIITANIWLPNLTLSINRIFQLNIPYLPTIDVTNFSLSPIVFFLLPVFTGYAFISCFIKELHV